MKTPWLAAAAIVLSLVPETGNAQGRLPHSPSAVGALPRGRAMGTFQRGSLEKLLGGSSSVVDSLDVIVFRVSFVDRDFAAGHDPTYFENELAHLREYYLGASNGAFHLKTDLFPEVIALSGLEGYYGRDELWKERMAELLIELVQKTDSGVDFSRYDAFAIIHAGAGQETDFAGDSPNQVSSGFVDPEEMVEALKDTLGTSGVPTDDLIGTEPYLVTNLMIWPEEASQDGYVFGSLGICAYQVGLRLGMIPLYDTTPGDFPDSQGIGNFDLMGYGIYNAAGFIPAFPCAFNRYLMGWAQPVVLEGDCVARLADIGTAAPSDTALVKVRLNPSEYYLIENRVHDTNFNGRFDFTDRNDDGIPDNADGLGGAEFDFFLTATTNIRVRPDSVLTGSGLMIYHVDEFAIRRSLESGNNPNDDARWKGVDIEEADGVQDLDSPSGAFAFGSYYDSFRNGASDRFGPDTKPASLSNGCARTGIEITALSPPGHYMRVALRLAPPMDPRRGEFAGGLGDSSPIPADLEGDGVEELVIAADTGLVYVAGEAGEPGWPGDVGLIFTADSAVWSGPPALADVDGDGSLEIFITSANGTLYSLEASGAPFVIDDDATPETLKLRGDRAASAMAFNFDVDPEDEIIALSSTADSTYLCVVGYDGRLPTLSGTEWARRGQEVEIAVLEGRIASQPTYSRWEDQGGGGASEGICVAVRSSDGMLRFHYVLLKLDGSPRLATPGYFASTRYESEELLVSASGDVDRDGADETVFAVSGQGLSYMRSGEFIGRVELRGAHCSAPVLADIDGDGSLETALRDEGHLYLFSGFGTPVSGWPKKLDDVIAAHDDAVPQAPPVIGDVNGDGRAEVVFRVAGDLRAFDFSGKQIEGWPLPGEGTAGGSLALLRGAGSALYIFDSASFVPYSVDESASDALAFSSLRRYDPDCAYSEVPGWPMARHDAGGSSRQTQSPATAPREERIDPSTFIIYPNPVTGERFTIRILISARARVKVRIVNLEGEKVIEKTLSHDWFEGSAVPFEEAVQTSALASGIYICRIEVSGDGWTWNGSRKFAVTR